MRRPAGLALVAGVVVLALGVDPGSLASAVTRLVTEDVGAVDDLQTREDNFKDVVGGLDIGSGVDATPITGDAWVPAPDDDESDLPSDLPEAGQQTVALAAGTESTEPAVFRAATVADAEESDGVDVTVGGLPLTVAPVADAATPDAVTIRVADQIESAAAGVTGVMLDLSDASEAPRAEATRIQVSLDYSKFAGLAGGDWASRLHLVQIPACAHDTPADPRAVWSRWGPRTT
ncbi:hypothetical protein GCM10025864_36050 [Luteimicrobium album]|uniref:Uncharacterized protein n=1 Tax=Luteimicrobium album TaxID=1054550 RepID=A0ABQ6I6C5_9MICO|nr:hypothetical protein [Luteimicrobium album]GMA25846.1 hypothetical protein GCM10025864_36050 [Luteimicrobium album]